MRRFAAFWLAWALPAVLWGAEVVRPVQLSLDFAAPLRVAAVLPSAPLPAGANISAIGGNLPAAASALPSSPQAALPASAPAIPESVAAALKAGDAHAFYRAVAATGYDLPRGDDHQERLLKEGADREAADRAFFDGQRRAESSSVVPDISAARRKSPASKRATKLDYEEFGRLLALTPRLSESPLRDTEAKRRVLMAAGYTHLIGPGGRRIPLLIADEARVGRAFQHTLATYRRRGAQK